MKTRNNLTLALAAVAAVTWSCRSKLDVQTKDGGQAPATVPPDQPAENPTPETPPPPAPEPEQVPTPVEKPNALSLKGGKFYFQTRDTITITINKEVIEGAPTFSLLNVTNAEEGDGMVPILEEQETPEGLSLTGKGFALVPAVEGDKVVLAFYPGNDEWKGKFLYGRNKLKVVANDPANPRYAYVELTLQDFDVFGVAITSFQDNVQVKKVDGEGGYQFQGWVNVLSPPTVLASDNSTTLTHGLFNMVNPQ